ncbi:hypothetical protein [Micromonospora sp. NPDC049274]|uniref:hypothetical protein n=1 Tax=Micromonospora sp. NPDC049274 TaxID=3154829 RepID=UPI003442115F
MTTSRITSTTHAGSPASPAVATIPVRIQTTDTTASGPHVDHLIVAGWPIAPGLAVHITMQDGQRLDGRYNLAHLPSGLAIARMLCARHVDLAAVAAMATGIDWTDDAEQVIADERTAPLRPGYTTWDWCGYDAFCRAEAYPRPDSPIYVAPTYDFRTRCVSQNPASSHRCDLTRGHDGSHQHKTTIWPAQR